jgi:hypothetical protein
MSYGVELTRAADDAFNQLPPMVASTVLDRLDDLARDPIGLGRPSHFPYLPGRQLFQFWAESEGRWWVTILFRFSQDEQRVVILDVVGVEVPEE